MTLDPDSISRLYETHAAVLLRYLARRTLQSDVAIDLVAETFANAFAHRDQFRGETDTEAVAWLFWGLLQVPWVRFLRWGGVGRVRRVRAWRAR